MPRPEILGSERSSYTRIARMVCEEKAIDYLLTTTALRAPELFAVHPFGRMPVLRHGDFTLYESKAIATYLDRMFPGPELIPSNPRLAAGVEQWVSLINTDIDPTLIRTLLFAHIAPGTADGKPDRNRIDTVMPRVREQLTVLEQAVAATDHLVGDTVTLADIFILPILFYVRLLPETQDAFVAGTSLGRYYDWHAARPSFLRTVPPLGPPRRA